MSRTLSLTLGQIAEIFIAGCQRGSDEAVAFERGSAASGERDDDLAAALCEIINAGRRWGDPGYIAYGTLAQVWDNALAGSRRGRRPVNPVPASPAARRYPVIQRGHGGYQYGPWRIRYDPPPIPVRTMDWHFTHEDFDASYEGEEDGWVGNGLSGSCASFADALNECDEMEDEIARASVGRNPEGEDAVERLRAEHEHAVPSEETADAQPSEPRS